MENKFKHAAYYKVNNYTHAEEISVKLRNLGYSKGFVLHENSYRSFCSILINYTGHKDEYSFHNHDCNSDPAIRTDNEAAFLAIAAIKKGEFNPGEHYIFHTSVSDWPSVNVGTVIKTIQTKENQVHYEWLGETEEKNSSPFFTTDSIWGKSVRKMTPEEIIEFYKNKEMADFYVRGSKPLKWALLQTLQEEGFKIDQVVIDTWEKCDYALCYSKNAGIVSGTYLPNSTPEKPNRYDLPQQWNQVLEAFRAIKKEIIFELKHSEGILSIKLEKDKLYCIEESLTFSIDELKYFLKSISLHTIPCTGIMVVSLTLTTEVITIGCKKGIKVSDLQELEKEYSKHF